MSSPDLAKCHWGDCPHGANCVHATAPDPQPPAAPETDVSALADWLRGQMALGTSGRFILDFGWSPDNLAEEIHAALLADLSAARERVREVESERDQWRGVAIRRERLHDQIDAATARAESAEAAHANAEADYDRRGERLWRLAAKAGYVPTESDNDATAELAIADALAAHEALRAELLALAEGDLWEHGDSLRALAGGAR